MYDGLKNLELPTKRKHPGARRVAKYSGILLLCLAVLFGASAVATYRYVQGKLSNGNVRVEGLSIPPLHGARNILILGSDDREGLTAKERKQLHISRAGGRRSDTIILLHINPDKNKAVLVHFPRDLLVPIPGRGTNRINTAFAFGGRNLITKVVKNLTGLKIHHYIEINFSNFKNLVDAAGGVKLYFPKAPLTDRQSGLNIRQAGCVQLDGTQALAFVRARHIYPNADLGRIEAQQRFMRALLGKVKSPGTIANFFKVRAIADAIGDKKTGLKHDPGVTLGLGRQVAGALSKFGSSGVDFRIFPSSTRSGSPFVFPNYSQAREFFRALAADRTLPPYGKTKQSKADAGDVHVTVFNGTSKSGLAGIEASRLRRFKFDARVGGNARHVAKTIIKYAPDSQQEAVLVASKYPGADLVLAQNQDVDVAVILGPDRISPSAKPTTAAKPSTPKIGEACD